MYPGQLSPNPTPNQGWMNPASFYASSNMPNMMQQIQQMGGPTGLPTTMMQNLALGGSTGAYNPLMPFLNVRPYRAY